MTTRQTFLAAAVVGILVTALGYFSVIAPASAQQRPGLNRWEYAQLLIAPDKWVFIQRDSESNILPPRNPLSGNVVRGSRKGTQYATTVTFVRNNDVGTLNIVGADGWEAVSTTTVDKGLLVLLKRRL